MMTDNNLQNLDPKAVWLFFWRSSSYATFPLLFILTPLVLSAVTFTAMAFIKQDITSALSGIIMLAAFSIGLTVVVLLLLYKWSMFSYKKYKYKLSETHLQIIRGVIWKKNITIPLDRVQNVDIQRGIIARYLQLSDLLVHTAGYGGNKNAEGRIPGLSIKTAEYLRTTIIDRIHESEIGI